MKTRILVGVIGLPALFLMLALLPAPCAGLVTGVIAAFCMWELRRSLGIVRGRFDYIYAALIAALLTLRSSGFDARIPDTVLYVLPALVFCEFILRYEKGQDAPLAQLFGSVFAVAVIPCALSSVAALRVYGGSLGRVYVLAPFLSAFITDAGAYFAGVFLGRTHAFPRVSPKKTVAGCVGGICAGAGIMYLYWFVLTHIYDGLAFPVVPLLILGLGGSAATIFGDLVFSLIKRVAGIKDYGNVLPGHGGMLDRFDSLILAGPVIYFIITAGFPAL